MKKGYLNKYMKVVAKDVSETINLSITEKIRLNTAEGTNTIKSNTADNINIKAEIGYPVFTSFPFYDETLDTYTDGKTMIYPLPRDQIREDVLDVTNNLETFSKETIVSCDSIVTPDIVLNNIPIDYAYTEDNFNYKGETIEIDRTDIDLERDIEFDSIRGQTFQNLLVEPIINEETNIPVELSGKDMELEGLESETLVPIREIKGDTYINLLEDKIKNSTIKPVANYNGDVVDGTHYKKEFIINDMDNGLISRNDGVTITENGQWKFDPHYYNIKNTDLYIKFKGSASTSICFYDINKTFISAHNDNFTKTVETKLTIPSNAVFVRFCWYAGAGDGSYVKFCKIPYNLDSFNKVTIDEIKGNTKVYNEPIPVADYKTNAFCCDLVLQSIDNAGRQDLNKKQFLGSSDYIYIKDFNKSIYVRVYEKGSTIPKGFGATWYKYDDNLKYIGKSGWAIDDGARPMNITYVSYIKLVLTNNNEEVEHQEGLYDVVISDTKPTGYIEPTILGPKTFPIQSVGELYVDEQGEPILDNDNNEQYKINIISSNNIWDGKKFNTGYSNGADGFSDQSYYNSVKLQDNYSMKITKTKFNTGFYSGTIIVDNILNYSKLYASCRYINNDNGLKDNSQIWHCDFYDVSGNFLSRERQFISVNSSNLYQTSFNVPSGAYTARFFIQGDINEYINAEFYITNIKITYKEEKTVTPIKTTIKSILLPQPLRSHVVKDASNNEYKCCDRLYWDNEKSKYCIEKNIISFKTGNINYTGQTNITNEVISSEFRKIQLSSYSSTFMYEGCQYVNWGSSSLNIPNIIGVKRYNVDPHFRIVTPNNMSNEVISEILSNKVIYGESKESEIIETNITEKINLPCYDGTTIIYTNGTSSHDEVNLPPIEELKGEITCTTLPLSITAYIKPNTQYTMFMNTDCKVNYNLGGIEKEYKPRQGKILITTPSTLSNNTLTLLGEGNIGNVTLLEGDYTNSYVPDKFINDVFSVGDLQEDGSYKIDVVSRNKNEGKYEVKSISLPQPLRRVGDVCDRFYWDSTKGKMCIEKNIIPINHAIQKEGINLLYIGSGDGCGEIHYNINGISDLKINSRIICNKFTSFNSKNELLTEGRAKGVEGISSNDGGINTVIFSFNRNRVKNLDINTIAQWFVDNNVIIQYYITSSPEIIETDITEPIKINIFDTDTTITTTSTVKPNIYLKSDTIIREALITSGEIYYIYAKTTGPVDINLGGSTIRFNPEDIVKQINTPDNNDMSQTIKITGNKKIVTDVMIRKDNRTDIKYFEGLHFVGDPVLVDDVTKYKIKYNIIGGKNILNANDLYNSWKAYGISDSNLNLVTFDSRQCIRIMCNGSLFNRNYYFGFIKENTQYTLSFNGYYSNLADPSITDGECLIINTTTDSYVLTSDNANQWNSYVFTNEENTTLESICGANQAANYLFIDIDSIQLEKNSEGTEYTPFQGYIKEYLLNEPLRAIGKVFDELTLEGKVIRRINKQILDADLINLPSTMVSISSAAIVKFNLFNNQINNINQNSTDRFISNKLAIGTNPTSRTFKIFGPSANMENALVIPKSNLSSNDKAGIIEWLNSIDPTIVYYTQYDVIEKYDYTTNDMLLSSDLIECIVNSQFPTPYTIINVPYKGIRAIEKPTNLSLESETYTHTISWEGDLGVEEYDVKVGDKLIGTAKYPETSLVTTEEMQGNLTVTAKNFLTESLPSDPLAVITLPNSTKITVFRNGFDIDGKRILEFDYSNNSEIATGYKLYYRIDDNPLQSVDLGLNEIPTHRFKVDSITHHIDMKMVAYNSVGETDYVNFKQFLIPPTMDWTYTTSNNSLLIRWFDKATNDSYWRILVYGEDQTLIPATMKNPNHTYAEGETDYNSDKFVTEGELANITVAGDGAGVDGELREYISLPRDINKNVSLLMVDDEGYEHLAGKPIKMGHSLDLTLLPPKDFMLKWIDPDNGIIEFSWIDNYTKENKFELRYSLNGSQEKVISIPTESKPQQGKKYVYRYTFPEKGILTARLRMSWDLNNSEFTQYVSAHYVEVTGLPPKYIIKKFTDTETLRIGWEEQPYVKYYNVSITIDGVQTTHIVENISYIDIDMKDKYDKTIKVDIMTRFINDVISDKSDPRQWISTKSNNPTLMLNCNEQHSLFAMNQNIVQTMLEWPYLNYFRITSQFMKDFEIITKFLSTGNIGYYPLETNVWGKALTNAHILNTVVYQQGVQTPTLLTTICKNFIEAFNELRMTVYYSQTSNYYLNTEVNKVRIVCFGDSITAGHPGFWD